MAGASARTRGRPQVAKVGADGVGCIRASAGEPGCGATIRCARWVHPRQRGGAVEYVDAHGEKVGASARTRRSPRRHSLRHLHDRCIRTNAGEPVTPPSRVRRSRGHPRERGGAVDRGDYLEWTQGASARAQRATPV